MRVYYSLYDRLLSPESLFRAFRKVKAHKGKPGVDGQTVEAFAQELNGEIVMLVRELRDKSYRPKPVKRVEIPKDGGGVRELGIPTVRDRVVQQALLEILQPIFDPTFHPSSYGYRPGHSAHQAIAKAELFIRKHNLRHVADMDLSRFLDATSYYTPCHDRFSKRPCCTSNTLIYKPDLFPERTWTAEISPHFTRCNTVWRDTPSSFTASSIGT